MKTIENKDFDWNGLLDQIHRKNVIPVAAPDHGGEMDYEKLKDGLLGIQYNKR